MLSVSAVSGCADVRHVPANDVRRHRKLKCHSMPNGLPPEAKEYYVTWPAQARSSVAGTLSGFASRSRSCSRARARQRDHRLEARRVVLESQLAGMEMRDGGGEAQAQPRARLGAALLEAHEPLDRATAVGLRNARPAIGDREQDAVPLPLRGHQDLRAVHRLRVRLGIFDGVVDEIRQCLADEL